MASDGGSGLAQPTLEAGSPGPALDPARVAALYVDDFEDFDGLPRSGLFAAWQRFSYNPPSEPVALGISEPGLDSNASLRLDWYVRDKPDGLLDYPGAGVRTLAANDYVDLSMHTHLLLAHRHEATPSSKLQPATSDAGVPTCRSVTRLVAYIPCRQHATQVEAAIPLSESWQTASLPLSDFTIPSWLPSEASVQDCLSAADALVFRAQAELADGECSAGSLWLDSISLR